jgi:C-terminal processing protease CtpA/Prc
VPDPGFVASRNFDGPMSVIALTPGGEAERVGLQVGDFITEIEGKPASEESNQQLARMNTGETLSIKIRSRGRERQLQWKVTGRQEISFQVKDLDHITPEHRARRAVWLKGEAEAGAPTQ